MKYALISPVVTTQCTGRDQTVLIGPNTFGRTSLIRREQKGSARWPHLLLATHQSTYSELTDSSSRMRRIVSANSAATDNCRMRPQAFASADSGIVSVT